MRAVTPKTRIAVEFRVFCVWTASIAALPTTAAITAVLIDVEVNMMASLGGAAGELHPHHRRHIGTEQWMYRLTGT